MEKEQQTPPKTPKEPGFLEKWHQIICFFTAIVICCGIYVFAICRQNRYMIERQNKIIKTFEAHSLTQSNTNTNIVPYIQNFSPKTVEDEKVYEEMKSLLDLEFNKIQNEFEALEIWAGVLTVIFLIFSFYSLFKTEQMEQQSKTALRLINDTQAKSDALLKNMEDEREKKIKSIEDSFKSWADKKEKVIRRVLDDKSKKYQKQLMNDYNAEFEKKVEEIRDHFNTMAQESISSSERVMGEEVQKFIEEWNTKMEQVVTDFEKRKEQLFSQTDFVTREDFDRLFEEEPEEGETIDNADSNNNV